MRPNLHATAAKGNRKARGKSRDLIWNSGNQERRLELFSKQWEVMSIIGRMPGGEWAHLTFWQSLADETRIPSPCAAGRGLGRGAIRNRLKSIGPQCPSPRPVLMSCPSLLLSPRQAWRGESDHLSTGGAFCRRPPSQKLRCARGECGERVRVHDMGDSYSSSFPDFLSSRLKPFPQPLDRGCGAW